MGKINVRRVFLGGLLAGLVINIGETILNMPILGRDWEEAMQAVNRPPMSDTAVALFVLMGFGLGIVVVWIYAAIRPRLGAGPKTAVCAGVTVWVLAYAYPALGMFPMDLFPARLLWITMLWGLLEAPIATVAGAWLYREEA